jgi:N6-adenosine-specific RNA methylase IME4
MGNYWRNSHEFMLITTRGKAKRFNECPSGLHCNRGCHSAKPEQVRAMIERASDGSYVELFGRRQVPGWTVFGDQIECSVPGSALAARSLTPAQPSPPAAPS